MTRLLFFVLFLTSNSLFSQSQTIKIYYLGNGVISLDKPIPKLLQEMFDAEHKNIKIDYEDNFVLYLRDYLGFNLSYKDLTKKSNNKTETFSPEGYKILNNNYDFVLLQETTLGVIIPEFQKYYFENTILKFDSLLQRTSSKMVLYQCNAFGKYPDRYCANNQEPETYTDLCTKEFQNSVEVFNIIENAFDNVRKRTKATISPVGKAYEICKEKFPNIVLYKEDGFTPTDAAKYLSCCVLFKTFTNEKAINIRYNANLSSQTAQALKEVADLVF